MRKYKILSVNAKCSDMCFVSAGNLEHDGYVPRNLGIGGWDYIELDIDIETGRILGWPELTDEDIEMAIKGEN